MDIFKLTKYLDKILNQGSIPERSFVNGLELVSNNSEISKITGIVSPNINVFQKALKNKPDLILAHHGLLKIESQPFLYSFKDRINFLNENNISYISYHIPLDVNEIYGNNTQLVKLLKLKHVEKFGEYHGIKIGYSGKLPKAISDKYGLEKYLKSCLNIKPLEIIWPRNVRSVNNISVISGGGARSEYFYETKFNNIDCYVSGNIDEGVIALCNELGIVYVAAGHYNTEKWGVIALGNHLQNKFNIHFNFIEDNYEKW
ncbi:MAG TPA: Nif3-like dinuclear metal center hexameric protein [Patescibacteria group bacterium]|nr:Nif3-like dinuclear metal center hexameric protein [Patescibacteria group bacterium]